MLSNTRQGYGMIAIVFHWLIAIGIFGMFGLGLYMVELTYYDNWYHGSLATHKAIGVLLFGVLLLRLGWKASQTQPEPAGHHALENRVAHLAHLVLYGVMLVLFISGYLISTADGRPVDVFGLFGVPSVIAERGSQEEIAGEIHEIAAWLLIGMVVLHLLAALKHHLIDKDHTLIRMLKPVRKP